MVKWSRNKKKYIYKKNTKNNYNMYTMCMNECVFTIHYYIYICDGA